MPFELNVENFFWIQGVIVILGIAFLLWRPKSQKGFTLKLGKPNSAKSPVEHLSGKAASPINPSEKMGDFAGESGGTRSLQVFFNYNGHSFEAYEVLGLPAGSSVAKVEAAFKQQLDSSDSQSRPFIEAAFRALKASRN